MLPSFASIRDENWPPARRSTVAAVVCQSSEAAFHCLMSSGVVHARQTSSIGATIFVSTAILSVITSPHSACVQPVDANAETCDKSELLDVTDATALRAHAFVL